MVKEIEVVAKNQPGELHKVAKQLGDNGVNMMALCAYTIGEEGRIHFVVNDHEKGKTVLKKLGYDVREGNVLVLELKHSAGEFSRVTDLLASAGVNIELTYGSGSTYPSAQLVVRVDDIKKAEDALALD